MTRAVLGLMLVLVLAGCVPTGEIPVNPGNSSPTEPQLVDDPNKVVVYFFWGDGCPHCTTQKPYLQQLEDTYPEVEVKRFETWKNPGNAKLFSDIAKAYGTSARGVPTTFIGDEFWVGFTPHMATEMENTVKYCIENACRNPADYITQ